MAKEKEEMPIEDVKVEENTAAPGENQEPVIRGRDSFMERYRGANPDIEDDVDDDTLFDFANTSYGELDEKYGNLNASNKKLAEVISKDPRFAKFIAMVGSGENLMYSLGKSFGNLIDQLNDKDLENLRKGQEEQMETYNRIKGNFDAYEKNLQKYASENGLSEDVIDDINTAIAEIAEAFIEREIPEDLIEIVHKGLDYDEAVEVGKATDELALKNKAIEMARESKTSQSKLPDVSNGGSKPASPMKPKLPPQERQTPYIDELEIVR